MNSQTRKERISFAILLGLQALVYGYLILARRFPKGHDTQSVFLLQYLFQAHGGGALWLPHLAHGVVSTWFATLQAGLLQNATLLAGGLPTGTPLLPVFYAGLFLEDLVLLIGVWRLGRRWYRSPVARFVVGLAALGGSLWISNLYWNHRLIYAVPLVLSLLLDVLDTGSRPKLLLAVSLMSLTLLGNAPYIPVLSGLAIGAVLVLYGILHRKRLRASAAFYKPKPIDAAWLAAMILVAGSVCVSVLDGLGSIATYHPGRDSGGRVTLDAFLTYAGGVNPLRYLDFLIGFTPSKDYSVYCGVFTLLFAAAAFSHRPRKVVVALGASLLLLLLFSMGYLGIVGMLGYYAAPPLHFFRYISLAAPLVKLHLLLLAGFGVDAFLRPTFRRPAFAAAGLALAGFQLIYLHVQATDPTDPLLSFLERIQDGLSPRTPGRPALGLLVGPLALAGSAALFALRRSPAVLRTLVPLVLAVHGADVLRWRLQALREETVPLTDAAYAVQKVEPLPWIARRADGPPNERDAAFREPIFRSPAAGATYDYCDAFLHHDPPWSSFYVTQWSRPVDLLLRAQAGRRLVADEDPPPTLWAGSADLATGRIIGRDADRLQVFSAAHPAGTDGEVAELMQRPGYEGDVLCIAAPSAPALESGLHAKHERLAVAPKVLDFGANRIRVEVDAPAGAWLVYCDAWHPDWKATVNGAGTPVERANLAYKAVRLQAGRNEVEFRFVSPLRRATTIVIGVLSLLGCLGIVARTVAALRGRGWDQPVAPLPHEVE